MKNESKGNREWVSDFRVSWIQSDLNGQAKLSAIFDYLQETAWAHAESLGFGYEAAKKAGQIWVLVRLLIKMERYPVWREQISVETWPRGVDGLWAFREYRISDHAERVIGGASSSWMVLDLKSRKPVNPAIVKHALKYLNPVQAMDETAYRISIPDRQTVFYRHRITHSEIDFYKHVNNSRYIDWITDALDANSFKNPIRRFHINYISEARMEQEVVLNSSEQDGRFIIIGENAENGKHVFSAEIN
ncbi:MAG: hypothetical protein JW731_09020 [Bacteroidales bacterium]|nr:hypothetical protein [Bacteroidales bacterium]